jgi:hypothetical protein
MGEEAIMELEQIEGLMEKPQQELLLQWYDEELKHTVGGSAEDLVGVIGDMRKAFLNWCQQVGLNDLLCRQWGYPAKKRILVPAHLALAIGEYLAGLQGYHVAVPATTAVIIVLWAGDELCDGS